MISSISDISGTSGCAAVTAGDVDDAGCFLGWFVLRPHSGTQGQRGGECGYSNDSFLHFASSFPDMERAPDLFAIQRETERSFSY